MKTLIIRLYRYFICRCIVCGRKVTPDTRYCSFECCSYGGGIEHVTKHPVKSLLFGYIDDYRNHGKNNS
jgi:hypothetical protein